MKESRNKKNSSSERSVPGVEFGQLEKLLDFMAAHGLEEFEYEQAGLRIRLKKALASANAAPQGRALPLVSDIQTRAADGSAPPLAAAPPAPVPTEGSEESHTLKTPIVAP